MAGAHLHNATRWLIGYGLNFVYIVWLSFPMHPFNPCTVCSKKCVVNVFKSIWYPCMFRSKWQLAHHSALFDLMIWPRSAYLRQGSTVGPAIALLQPQLLMTPAKRSSAMCCDSRSHRRRMCTGRRGMR